MHSDLPEKILEEYQDSYFVRALSQLIPLGLGGAADTVLIGRLEAIRKKRTETFFKALAEGEVSLTKDVIESDDFLHKFVTTTKAALETRHSEKIALFANLLANGSDPEACDVEEYEDLLKILDELSFRELKALSILDRFSDHPRNREDNDLQWVNTFWDAFEEAAADEIGLPVEQMRDFMNRIARTGCYEIFTGGFMDYTGGKGKLTLTYAHLKRFVSTRA